MPGSGFLAKLLVYAGIEGVKYRREAKARKEFEEKIAFANRGFLATFIIYIVGFIICSLIMNWGLWGIILILLGYAGHFSNLNEAKQHVPIIREMLLSIISLIGLGIMHFVYDSSIQALWSLLK